MNRAKLSFDLKNHVLCIKLLPLLLCFHVLWGQDLEIIPERIEYIDPNSHQLIAVEENTIDFNSVQLSRDNNYLAVYLFEENHKHKEDHKYYYKLTQNNESYDWFSFDHEVRLVGLTPGKHRLCIAASNDDNLDSSEIYSIDIEVPPPIWLSSWFIGLVISIMVAVFAVWRVYEYRIFKIRKDRDLQISNLEARAYRAQMNPHFIFNALNGMQTAMILRGEQEFNKYVTSFSKLIRNTIEMSSVEKLSLSEEIEYIKNYIDLQALRLEKEIFLDIFVDAPIDINLTYLPCMMLQPIVENSIVHGLIPMDGVNKIKIDFSKKDNFLQCRVEDNGIGRKAAEAQREGYQKTHKSFATQIMKERINIFNYYNKEHLDFQIEDKYDEQGKASGTVVTLIIPLDFRTREK